MLDPIVWAPSLAVEQHRSMSALPNGSKEVLKYLFGSPSPKSGGAQPVAKHDQANVLRADAGP
eukprot:361752-Chlamydomonas_euryale.AAC.2